MPTFSSGLLIQRLEKLRVRLSSEKIDSLLISNQHNRYYLTGWLGDRESGYLLITSKKAFIITDSRYTEDSQKARNYALREYGSNDKFWPQLFSEIKVNEIGFEAKDLSVLALKQFKKLVRDVKFVPTQDLIEELRAQKDQTEVSLIKKSISIAEGALKFVLKNIKAGQTEKEIAWEMEKFMRENGAEKNAWDPFIVASGTNSSKVHYAAGERKIQKGDQVLLDWSCVYKGYNCDISRVIFIGEPNSKQVEAYNLVLEAQKKGIAQIKVGAETKAVDLAARSFFHGKTPYLFKHAVGHGVGLDVHELPHVNEKTKEKFAVGNVVTVEPGIYQPGWGGVRLEDMVLVTDTGYEALTKAPKEISRVVV